MSLEPYLRLAPKCRLEAEVLSGQLWHKECQERNADLPDDIPLSFPSADAYVHTFEPLLFEEARESVRGDWAEACEGPRARVWPARVARYAGCVAQRHPLTSLFRQTPVPGAESADQSHHT